MKGQTETFGLVIIVVLIVFITIFALQFMIKPKQGLDNDYLKLQANNLRNSVLKYSLCNVDIKEEIYNCESYNEGDCIDCNELQDIIKSIIDNSLEEKRSYSFKVGSITIKRGTCLDKIYATTEKYINSDLEVEFFLC